MCVEGLRRWITKPHVYLLDNEYALEKLSSPETRTYDIYKHIYEEHLTANQQELIVRMVKREDVRYTNSFEEDVLLETGLINKAYPGLSKSERMLTALTSLDNFETAVILLNIFPEDKREKLCIRGGLLKRIFYHIVTGGQGYKE